MKQSNYPVGTIKNILESGLKGYRNMVIKEIQGLDRINRKASTGLRARELKKLTGRNDWFKPSEAPEEGDIQVQGSQSVVGGMKPGKMPGKGNKPAKDNEEGLNDDDI